MDSFFCLEELPKKRQKTDHKKREEPFVEETWEHIVKRILFLSRMHQVNINTLALRAGMTPSTLKSILYGRSKNPGIVTLRHICDGLDISLEEFFRSKLFREW